MAWLLDRDSPAYASNQFRALQQFFKWLAGEDEVPDPMAGLKPPHVPDKPLPVFADSGLTRLERACAGRSFQQHRDAAIIACSPRPGSGCRSWRASATTRTTRGAATSPCGSGRSLSAARAVRPGRSRSGYEAARSLDRYPASRASRATSCYPGSNFTGQLPCGASISL
jgi:hypothetical protein